MSDQIYNIDNSFYVRVGDGVDRMGLAEIPESIDLFRFSEARRFQRCDGCGYRSGEFSEVFTCLYAKMPGKSVVRTTVLASHHSTGDSCMAKAMLTFMMAINAKVKIFE
jgi:hypothetical protein